MIENNTERLGACGYIVSIVCAITVLSQLPIFVASGVASNISRIVWFALFIILLVANRGYLGISNIKGIGVPFLLFLIYVVIGALTNHTPINASVYMSIIPLTIFILVVGTMVGINVSMHDLYVICTIYILCSLIVCSDVFLRYLQGASLSGRAYLYGSKNSVSQILLTAWILILFLKLGNKQLRFIWKLLYGGCFIFLTISLFFLKSRATVVAIPVIFLWIFFHKARNNNLKRIVVILTVIVVAYFVFFPAKYDSFVNDILFAGRNGSDLNDVSSGRIEEYETFFSDYSLNGFFGDVNDKRESLFLSSFLQHGFIGGVLIVVMALFPLRWIRKNIPKQHSTYLLMSTVAIAYIINAIFEQQAPFGPGVKCFFLWFMVGIFASGKDFGIFNDEMVTYGE